ncbi:methyl-accepting chemotaxis protein [Oxalobacteraceae bacterium GrIS 1.11]
MKMKTTKLKIGTRLSLCFTIILVLSLMTAGFSLWRLQDVAARTRIMMAEPLAKERMITDWYRYLYTAIRRTSAIAKSSDPALVQFFAEENASSSRNSSALQKSVEALLTSDKEKALFALVSEQRKTYVAQRDSIMEAKAAGQDAEVNRLIEQMYMPTAKTYESSLLALLTNQREEIDATAAQVEASYSASKSALLALAALMLVCGVGCTWALRRSVLAQLGGEPEYAATIAHSIAAGDLSVQVLTLPHDRSSLLYAMKTMRDSLVGIVSEVRGSTDTIATASSQIAAGNLDLSSRTEEQASSLEEIASTMEQATSSVKQNAESARQAYQLAVSASDVALKGGAVVNQVVDTMGSINAASRKIVEIISVIDGIAFQTNILALNAAVEAARAGEQGRGFAVVASEVRNLAQRATVAAKEIKLLISTSVEQVDAGSKLVEQAGSSMQEIVQSIGRVSDVMGEITTASAEQTSGIEQINQAISQMDEATQQNAALVEQAAAAAASLQDQANTLTQVVGVFKLGAALVPQRPAGRQPLPLPAPGARWRAIAAPGRPRAVLESVF